MNIKQDFDCAKCTQNHPSLKFYSDEPPYCIYCGAYRCMTCMLRETHCEDFTTEPIDYPDCDGYDA